MKTRGDGRSADALRGFSIEVGFQQFPEGSVIVRAGKTMVLVSASVDDGVRDFLRGTGKGWVTAEYAMHPRAGLRRQTRDGRRNGGVDGRAQEIQRLIGRALRTAVRPEKLGERTITIDCDVLDADGGTRTASITGGFVALALALDGLRRRGLVGEGVLRAEVAAVSVGLLDSVPIVDLDYSEDSKAEVDLNVVGTGTGDVVEIQGTAEDGPVPREHVDKMIELAFRSLPALVSHQRAALSRSEVLLDRLLG